MSFLIKSMVKIIIIVSLSTLTFQVSQEVDSVKQKQRLNFLFIRVVVRTRHRVIMKVSTYGEISITLDILLIKILL